MKRALTVTLLAASLSAGLVHAAPAGQFSTNSEGASMTQLYPATGYESQPASSASASKPFVASKTAAGYAAGSEGEALSQLYPGAEGTQPAAAAASRAEVFAEYQRARASGELRDHDNGLAEKDLFPQAYASRKTAVVR